MVCDPPMAWPGRASTPWWAIPRTAWGLEWSSGCVKPRPVVLMARLKRLDDAILSGIEALRMPRVGDTPTKRPLGGV